MAWTEAQAIARVSTVLNDTGTALWGTAEIRQGIDDGLITISEYLPRLAKSTVAFGGTARELSISSITDLMDVDMVEFPIDKHPRRYVNFSVRGSSVILDDYLPSVATSDTAYIWYTTPHELSGTATNTLNVRAQPILVELVAGELAINKSSKLYAEVNNAITTIATAGTALSNMSAQVGNAATALLTGGTALALVSPLILEAGTVLDKVDAQVTLATAAIAAGTAYINTIGVSDAPQADWVNYAHSDMGAANALISEAAGYISQAQSDESNYEAYGSLAMRDLSVASQYLNQASGYFRKATSQFSITSSGRFMEDWGQRMKESAMRKLRGLVQPNFSIRYPDVK